MQRAEAGIRWRNEDVLRFDRLEAFAHAVGADRLVIGWINTLDTESEGSLGGSPTSADIVVQVFDATQGRIVAETQEESFTLFGTRNYIAGRVLHLALVPAVPWLIARLAPTP